MKKITLLLLFILSFVFLQAQTNLLVNPSFENWTAGAPDGWTISSPANGAASETTVQFNHGSKSLLATGGSGTYGIYQSIPVTPGKSYTLTMSYYIQDGDGTDARIWSNFKIGTTFLSDAVLTTAGILEKLKGPGGSSSYFPDEKGSWKTYTIDNITAPADVTHFNFEFRTYKTPAIVYWDNMFFGEKGASATNNIDENSFRAVVAGKTLKIENVLNGTVVEIYSTIGNKVLSTQLENNTILLNNLPKGMYVVRVGKETQKIML